MRQTRKRFKKNNRSQFKNRFPSSCCHLYGRTQTYFWAGNTSVAAGYIMSFAGAVGRVRWL